MSTDNSELICPDCGAREQREAFCESCGAALSRAKPTPAAPAAVEESDAAGPVSVAARGSVAGAAADPGSATASSAATNPTSGVSAGPIPGPGPVANPGLAADTGPVADPNGNQVGSSADRIAAVESTHPASAPASAPTAAMADAPCASSVEEIDRVKLAESQRAESERAAALRAEAENAERARALLVPVADRSAPSGIAPVLPGVPDPIAPQRNRAEGLADLDAGIQCQWCATRNPPERHFCRKCGQRLAYAPVEAKRLSWWRRLIFFWRSRPLPFAGQRPRLRRGLGQAIRPVVWGVVLIVLIVVVVQEYKPVSTNVRDHFAKPNEISNWTVATSHADPNHPAKLLHDTYSDTWWGSGFAPQNSNGVSITVTFSQPTNLLDMGITPGAGTATDTFGAQGAPQTLDALLIPLPGKGSPTKKTFTLDDQAGFQKLQLRGDDIRQVVLTITSSYDPTGVGPAKANQTETAITELEFYSRH